MKHTIATHLIVILGLFSVNILAQKPETRWLQEMTYDEANERVLMFGGVNRNKMFNDMWSLQNSVWTKLCDHGPSGSIKSAFAYDANRKCAVLFGGSGGEDNPLGETWEWDGKMWKQIKITGPSARVHPLAAYDPQNKVIVIFGGVGNEGLFSDTWIYDGKTWTQKDTSGPKNCLAHGIFYDEVKKRIVLVTLYSGPDLADNSHSKNEMWEWSGSSWQKLPNGGLSTSLNSLQALAPFENEKIVLFDGDDISGNYGKTWTFSGGHWMGASLPGPTPRVGHSMVYDKSKHRTILFGGSDRKNVFNDLWEWNGKEWNQVE